MSHNFIYLSANNLDNTQQSLLLVGKRENVDYEAGEENRTKSLEQTVV